MEKSASTARSGRHLHVRTVLTYYGGGLFKEKGIFNQEVAASFRENILSKGGTEHPMTLYKRFRGQEPSIHALLKRNGIIN